MKTLDEMNRENKLKMDETKKRLTEKLNETNQRCMTEHMKIIQKIQVLQKRFKTQLPK